MKEKIVFKCQCPEHSGPQRKQPLDRIRFQNNSKLFKFEWKHQTISKTPAAEFCAIRERIPCFGNPEMGKSECDSNPRMVGEMIVGGNASLALSPGRFRGATTANCNSFISNRYTVAF
jgi:hypothetical protein